MLFCTTWRSCRVQVVILGGLLSLRMLYIVHNCCKMHQIIALKKKPLRKPLCLVWYQAEVMQLPVPQTQPLLPAGGV